MADGEAQRMMWFTGDPLQVRAEPGREIGWTVENLRKPGFEPATVVDVGAGRGTGMLYKSFPDAYHVLIEPLSEFTADLEQWLTRFQGEHLQLVVGESDGSATLNVDPELPIWSSLLGYSGGRAKRALDQRTVQMTTVDGLLAERGWKPPFGLKMDAEGYEHQIIAGATRLLEQAEFVISEVSVAKRFEDSYTFAEFVALMDDRGFELYDVLDGMRAWHGRVWFVDAMFTRK